LAESEFPLADSHGQYRFNYRHQHIPKGREERFLLKAFQRDFEVNGPSLARLIRTLLKGWKRYKDFPDKRIRDRFAWEVKPLRTNYAAAVWAMKRRFRTNKPMAEKMNSLLQEIYKTFGWKTRIIAPLAGIYVYAALKKEERRLANGWTYEPDCFYEKNAAALAVEHALPPYSEPLSPKIRYGSCKASPVPGR